MRPTLREAFDRARVRQNRVAVRLMEAGGVWNVKCDPRPVTPVQYDENMRVVPPTVEIYTAQYAMFYDAKGFPKFAGRWSSDDDWTLI